MKLNTGQAIYGGRSKLRKKGLQRYVYDYCVLLTVWTYALTPLRSERHQCSPFGNTAVMFTHRVLLCASGHYLADMIFYRLYDVGNVLVCERNKIRRFIRVFGFTRFHCAAVPLFITTNRHIRARLFYINIVRIILICLTIFI